MSRYAFAPSGDKKTRAILLVIACTYSLACIPPSSAAVRVAPSVECDSGCKPEWERAQVWLAKHSNLKVQTATDVLLQTYTSVGTSTDIDYTVLKEPLGGGRYRITARTHCANSFGCVPGEEGMRDALLAYVKTGNDPL